MVLLVFHCFLLILLVLLVSLFFIGFTCIGLIPLLIWHVTKGTAGPNRFGPDPLGSGEALPEPPTSNDGPTLEA